jgi:hypothetical protein
MNVNNINSLIFVSGSIVYTFGSKKRLDKFEILFNNASIASLTCSCDYPENTQVKHTTYDSLSR